MTERQNPLYHEKSGRGLYNAIIEYDGMNRFTTDDHRFHMYDRQIAKLEGATLRYSDERDVCDMKVYHPTETDYDGDTCSIAVYDFYNLRLKSMHWGMLYFAGLLTSIRHHGDGEPVIDERDGYPYIPPIVPVKELPLPVTLRLWVPQPEDKND